MNIMRLPIIRRRKQNQGHFLALLRVLRSEIRPKASEIDAKALVQEKTCCGKFSQFKKVLNNFPNPRF